MKRGNVMKTLRILEIDPYLKPFEKDLELRMELCMELCIDSMHVSAKSCRYAFEA